MMSCSRNQELTLEHGGFVSHFSVAGSETLRHDQDGRAPFFFATGTDFPPKFPAVIHSPKDKNGLLV